MPEYLLRKRQIQRHEHNRPINRMESYDFLPDEVDIRWPKAIIQLRIVRTVS
ncbi:hypothetical protein D3C77_643110 [compost metagenome]